MVEQQTSAGKRVVFFFDEMPYMLTAIADPQRDGPQAAMEILDVLRSLRQSSATAAGFRMVLCGSIGLHHILNFLRKQGYGNRPVNDMLLHEVPPLDDLAAADLAHRLLQGEGIIHESVVVEEIVRQTGGFPYYIHQVIAEMRTSANLADGAAVERAVRKLITADHDPCDFRYYLDRLGRHYPGEERIISAVLDHAAVEDRTSLTDLINVAKSAGSVDDDRIRELLRQLGQDHYVIQTTEGTYAFRHSLIRRWWLNERGLA